MMRIALGVGSLLVGAVGSLHAAQIGYLWTFEELTAKADLVVVAEFVNTDDTGRRMEHPNLKPAVPVAELTTAFKVLAVLKPDAVATSSSPTQVRLSHYRLEWDVWRRINPAQPGRPPPGVMNSGSVLDFGQDAGPYLLFLKRSAADFYEPLSGHTFPTDSVYLIRKLRARQPHVGRRVTNASTASACEITALFCVEKSALFH